GSTHLPLGLARSYAWQNERAGSLSMLVVATSAGEMVLACHTTATAKATTMPAACAKLAQTVRIDGATVEYPGADPHLASVVSGGLASRDRAVDSTALHATSLASRAQALDRVAKVDAQAASALRSTSTSARYRIRLTSLAEALARESGAIDRMASAAASDKRGTYEASREQLAAYLSKLRASSNALVALGFSMRPVAALQLAALARPHRRSASASTTPSAHVSAPSATQAPPARAPQTPVAPPTPTYRPPVKSTPQHHSNAAPKTIVSAPS
ncbi:MAG TPA: hypothetical protein VN804_01540, partial [Solirubrobacteraceae bacterium]|nr:hypothetical protein [Solirubrobacteraceae bacterium]